MPALGQLAQRLQWNRNAGASSGRPFVSRALPLRAITGITSRNLLNGQGNARALIDSTVFDFWVADAVASYTGGVVTFDAAWLAARNADFAWCAANTGTSGRPIMVALRPNFGMHCPPGMSGLTYLPWYSQNGASDYDTSQPDPLTVGYYRLKTDVPLWWGTGPTGLDAGFDAFFVAVHTALAAAFGTKTTLAEIDMSYGVTQFQEPCIRQLNSTTNLNTASAYGYTQAIDAKTFARGWAVFNAIWAPLGMGCYTSYNPIGVLTTSPLKFSTGGAAATISLNEVQMAMTGGLCVLSNKSLASDKLFSSFYADLYARQIAARAATPPTLIRYQTETFTKIAAGYASSPSGNTQDTFEMACATMLATSVELPVGCEDGVGNPVKGYTLAAFPKMYVTPALAASWNTRFYANAAGLVQDH